MEKLKKLEHLAWLLDSSIRIPGTSINMGIDSLIGLIPGIGDVTGGIISSYIIWQAVEMGVPRVVLIRMGINVVLETILGAVPIVGDIFDIAFKSNRKNVQLLANYYQSPQVAIKRNTISVVVVGVSIMAVFVLIFFISIKLIAWVISAIG
jgi:Domain of unknown function (DUF4112)